jgi:hypothetical protein
MRVLRYSTTQARALRAAGHAVLVVCASPDASLPDDIDGDREVVVLVPEEQWGSLQADGPWESFADNVERDARVVDAVRRFAPDAVLAVDWHGYEAARRILPALSTTTRDDGSLPPVIALNYRVFSRESTTPDVVRELEARAAREAAVTVALSTPDEAELRGLGAVNTAVVAPPLRADVRAVAIESDGIKSNGAQPKPLRTTLVCCVRLAPEKGAALFAQVVVSLASFLTESGVVPVLCAPPMTSDSRCVHISSKQTNSVLVSIGLLLMEFGTPFGRSLSSVPHVSLRSCASSADYQ